MIGRLLLLGAARKGGLAEAPGLPKAAPRLPAKAAGRPEAAGHAEAAARGSKAPRALLAVALLVHGGGVPRLRSESAGGAIKAWAWRPPPRRPSRHPVAASASGRQMQLVPSAQKLVIVLEQGRTS